MTSKERGTMNTFTEIQDKKFWEFIDAMDNIVLVFDKTDHIRYANTVAMKELGITEEPYPYMNTIIPLYQEQKVLFFDLAKSQKTALEVVMYRLNHTCFSADVNLGVWEGTDYGFCIATNKTDYMEMKSQMEQVQAQNKELSDMQNDFVANVTHELRTPLNGIKGHVEQLESMEEKTDKQAGVYQIIRRCCFNMEKIINNILDYNKLRSGKFQLEETEFSLSDCLRQIQDTNEPIANEKGVRFSVQIDSGVPDLLYGDGMHLQQILNNLVSNAIKFTENGFVTVKVIKVYQLGKKVELFFVVVDTGIGISAAEKERIFDSFVQADASITRKYGGTGLGLSITRDLLHMMGGTINLESEKGRGSTFSFSLVFQNVSGEESDEQVSRRDEQGIFDEIARQRKEVEMMYELGSEENLTQLRSNMEKLIICIEMGNWNKAERFATTIKRLLAQDEGDGKKLAFRMEMAVRREDYDKSSTLFESLKERIDVLESENR